MLEDFLAAAASMARKRHLASSARGFYCFCLMTHRKGIHPIRPIRGRTSQLIQDVPNVSPFHFLLKGARRNIPHDEPLGQSETKTITLRIHSIQVIPSGLLMSYRISLSEGVASVVSYRQRSGYYSFTTD